MPCRFIPPYLLRRIAALTGDLRASASSSRTLRVDEQLRQRRAGAGRAPGPPPIPTASTRIISHAGNTEQLPGRVARVDGDPPTGDVAIDEAYEWSGQTLELFEHAFARRSVDDRGSPVLATVHYARAYDNAFWDGTQLVFGDGDNRIFERFTKPIDVLAHEFTHGVTQHSAGFEYLDQPGALNESMSDVFGSMVKQYARGETAERADWLIGQGIFVTTVGGRALRSMLEPGTAYDDPLLGKDPQVASMTDYVHTEDDNGGVHINSGIPNRAFALLATELGGSSWERAGQIWYATLTSTDVVSNTDFLGFAEATVAAASRLYPDDPWIADQVRQAWRSVEVFGSGLDALSANQPADLASKQSAQYVSVRRTGGVAGIARSYQLDLGADQEGSQVRQLLAEVERQYVEPDMSAAPARSSPTPDRFVYSINYGDRKIRVGEVDLSPQLNQLIQLVVARGEEIPG
jgi:Thermolysin metallopeptidase, alpha-helical domain/Thermolysin metallopeptidase, catalytic domain